MGDSRGSYECRSRKWNPKLSNHNIPKTSETVKSKNRKYTFPYTKKITSPSPCIGISTEDKKTSIICCTKKWTKNNRYTCIYIYYRVYFSRKTIQPYWTIINQKPIVNHSNLLLQLDRASSVRRSRGVALLRRRWLHGPSCDKPRWRGSHGHWALLEGVKYVHSWGGVVFIGKMVGRIGGVWVFFWGGVSFGGFILAGKRVVMFFLWLQCFFWGKGILMMWRKEVDTPSMSDPKRLADICGSKSLHLKTWFHASIYGILWDHVTSPLSCCIKANTRVGARDNGHRLRSWPTCCCCCHLDQAYKVK